MSTTITAGNATNGLAFSADSTGQLEIKTGTGSGTTALTLDASQNATFAGTVTTVTGAVYPLVRGTAVTASGTSVTFTGIPATAKRITVMLSGVSTSGVSNLQIQIGSGSVITAGYVGSVSGGASGVSTQNSSAGFLITIATVAATGYSGNITISNISGNTWVESGLLGAASTGAFHISGGTLALGGVLDRVRITTVNGTDTFDAGSINILWE